MINNSGLEFSVDEFIKSLQNLDHPVEAKVTRMLVREAEASQKFVKADLGTLRNRDDGSIWRLDTGDDGNQYIVRTDSDDTVVKAGWTASPNRRGDTITLSYEDTPVRKFSSAEFGFDPAKASVFAGIIVDKAVDEQPTFVRNLLATLSFEDRICLQKRFAIFRQG